MCRATPPPGRVSGDRRLRSRTLRGLRELRTAVFVGDVIADERSLLVASPEMFRERFNIEVHTNTDVIAIDRAGRTIGVRDSIPVAAAQSVTMRSSCRQARPRFARGCRAWTGLVSLRSAPFPDSRQIRSWIVDRRASTAVIVGGGSSDWRWSRTSSIAGYR